MIIDKFKYEFGSLSQYKDPTLGVVYTQIARRKNHKREENDSN
jgi:hypothetical protein